MKNCFIVIILVHLGFVGNAFAQSRLSPKTSFSCETKTWKGPRNLTKQQWVQRLSSMSRESVREMAWGELLSKNSKPIFPVFLIYLAKTEANDLLAGYYEGILYLMNQSIPWRKVVENWPQKIRMKSLNRKYWTASKLCREYVRAGGE